MSFFRQLYKIARLEEMMEKFAGEGAGASSVEELKLSLWTQIKAAASTEPEGQAVGLAKIASQIGNTVEIAAGSIAAGTKTASTEERLDRDLLAVSFASALAVDKAVEKQAMSGELTSKDAQFLYQLNAQSAINDLVDLAKTAAPAWLTHPATIGALGGGALGAGIGAWGDAENRTRGAIAGGVSGAAIGGLGGLAYQHFAQAAKYEAAAAAEAAAAEAKAPLQAAVAHLEEHKHQTQPFGGPTEAIDIRKALRADSANQDRAMGVPHDFMGDMHDALHETTVKPEVPGKPDMTGKVYHAPEMHGASGGHQGPSKSSPKVEKK